MQQRTMGMKATSENEKFLKGTFKKNTSEDACEGIDW